MVALLLSWLAGCDRKLLEDGATSPPTDEDTSGSDTVDTPPITETAETGDSGTPWTGTTEVDCAIACDDGLDCTSEACDPLGRCVFTPLYDCPWPAVDPDEATSLAVVDQDLTEHQSGATWNPVTRELWLVRNAGPSGVWRLVEDGLGGWVVDDDNGDDAAWSDVGNVESLTLVDPSGAPTVLHLMDEGSASIVAFDLSTPDDPVELESWDLSSWLPDVDKQGAEALAFVPDQVLADQGFVDGAGVARTSALGMGGLMFVGHQNGGQVYVFDVAPGDNGVEHVGTFDTARSETSGLELDPSTSRLYLWHGGDPNDLEVARLSSTDLGGENRRLDTEAVFDHPGNGNLEGIAILGIEDCVAGGRPLILVEDDGGDRSVELFPDWPLGCP